MNLTHKLLAPVIITVLVIISEYFPNDDFLPVFNPVTEAVAEDDDNNSKAGGDHASVEIMAGRLVVHIPEEIQRQANLQLMRLARAQRYNEIHAFAQVIDIQSLLELRSRYREAQTEKNIAENVLQVSGQEFERLKLLRSEASNISERQLQQAKLEWMSSLSQLQAAQVKMENVRNQLLQGWGPVLAGQILDNTDVAGNLLERESVLLLVTLEGKQLLPANTDSILVNVHGSKEQAQAAYYISPASFTDNKIYGQSYFFHTAAANLPTGVYMDAWIPEGKDSNEGVYIPSAAVIWYVDKPWVYVKVDANTYARRELKEYDVTRDGWFVRKDFEPDEEIVLHGGQMLLSEEFRWSIPDEDDDP